MDKFEIIEIDSGSGSVTLKTEISQDVSESSESNVASSTFNNVVNIEDVGESSMPHVASSSAKNAMNIEDIVKSSMTHVASSAKNTTTLR